MNPHPRTKLVALVTGLVALVACTVLGAAATRDAQSNSSLPSGTNPWRSLSQAELLARLRLLDPDVPEDLTPRGGIGCEVQDAFGNRVNTVTALSQSGDAAYWLFYQNDGGIDARVRFLVTPNFEGSPLAGQSQTFETNDACNISTPFGVPFWGGSATAGEWLLMIRNDRGGVAICHFEVLP